MGDEKHRRADAIDQIEKGVEGDGGTFGIEIAGWFVGQQQTRARGESAGDGDALLLAARQLARIMPRARGESDGGQGLGGARFGLVAPRQFERQGDIFERGESRHQMKMLKDDADLLAAQRRARVFVERREIAPENPRLAAAGVCKPAMIESSEVLPDPEGPTSAARSPPSRRK